MTQNETIKGTKFTRKVTRKRLSKNSAAGKIPETTRRVVQYNLSITNIKKKPVFDLYRKHQRERN